MLLLEHPTGAPDGTIIGVVDCPVHGVGHGVHGEVSVVWHGVHIGHSRVGGVGMVHDGHGRLVGVGLVALEHVAVGHCGGVHIARVRVEHSSCMAHRLGSDHPARCTVVMVW